MLFYFSLIDGTNSRVLSLSLSKCAPLYGKQTHNTQVKQKQASSPLYLITPAPDPGVPHLHP